LHVNENNLSNLTNKVFNDNNRKRLRRMGIARQFVANSEKAFKTGEWEPAHASLKMFSNA
jgi:hypothetical protein